MTFDQLTKFAELMRSRAQSEPSNERAKEYETMAAIVDELMASREHFGAVSDARFLR